MDELTTKMSKTAIPPKTMVLKRPDISLNHISEFVTHIPPPVDERTRIIAVCGCVDFETAYEVFDFDEAWLVYQRRLRLQALAPEFWCSSRVLDHGRRAPASGDKIQPIPTW
ncbi:hypothetical protein PSPO01_06735 [Paraphaeosphaeria sporulosa]